MKMVTRTRMRKVIGLRNLPAGWELKYWEVFSTLFPRLHPALLLL